MLCRSVFKKATAPKGLKELVVKVARLVGRLPLGLSVLGSSLRGRGKEYWMDLLPRLQNGIDEKIEKTLRVSYDGLSSEEDKRIFRYIACYFNGEKVTYMKLLLADSGLSVNVGMQNLADRSLIHVREGHVEMHCLLQEMGRSIARLEEPEKREFLVDSQDICDVLSEGIGTQKVIGISYDSSGVNELNVHEKAFRGMRNLRFLKIYLTLGFYREVKCKVPESFDYLPAKLKLLRWDEYPMRCMPSKFRPENLVELKMENRKLEKLWEGIVSLPFLREMNLSRSQNLIEMPDLSKATNLERLELEDCYSLVKLPSSIPHPNKLMKLNMSNCLSVETIPIGISLKSLKELNLDGCSRLRTFPQISSNIKRVNVDKTCIEEIPSNLHLENLSIFSMQNPKSKKLCERVKPLTLLTAMLSPSLEKLYLSNISSLVELPCSFQNLNQLRDLEIKNCLNLETLPTGINLRSLKWLYLRGCSRLRAFPDMSTTITWLDLSGTAIEEAPCWIEKFSQLRQLKMRSCVNLETLPTKINLQSLRVLDLIGCSRLRTFPDISTYIEQLDLSETAIEEVPPWIVKFSRLEELDMNGCNELKSVSLNFLKLTGAVWFGGICPYVDLTECLNLDKEALFQQRTYLGCKLWLSGEEVPSYFTHRTTATSSLTVPLLPSSLSQPFLRFRACILFNCDNMSSIKAKFRFTGSFWNSSDSYDQGQDFCAETKDCEIYSNKKDSRLFILDCQMSQIPLEMNSVRLELKIHIFNSDRTKIKEWGIRLLEDCSLADNRLGDPNSRPHVFQGSEGKAEPSSKRMRIS